MSRFDELWGSGPLRHDYAVRVVGNKWWWSWMYAVEWLQDAWRTFKGAA